MSRKLIKPPASVRGLSGFMKVLFSLLLTVIFFSVSTNFVSHDRGSSKLNYTDSLEKKAQELREELTILERRIKNQSRISPMRKQVAFAKTHKTGSSTFQNILFRFGIRQNLTFAMPPEASWMFPFREKFSAKWVLEGPWRDLSFDLFTFHSVWNYREVKKVLPSAVYVTLLRDPVECFESNYVYMGLEKKFGVDINGFAKLYAVQDLPRRKNTIIDKNQQLWDLGVTSAEMEQRDVVESKIREFDRQFDLVMIMEKFDESLLLFQDLVCWPTQQLGYLKQNERIASQKSNITEESRAVLKKWLWADYLLYDYFAKKLNQKIEDASGLTSRKAELTQFNEKLFSMCVVEKTSADKLKGEFKMALPIVSGYVVNDALPWCALYARSEPNFVRQLNDFQTLRVKELRLRGIVT